MSGGLELRMRFISLKLSTLAAASLLLGTLPALSQGSTGAPMAPQPRIAPAPQAPVAAPRAPVITPAPAVPPSGVPLNTTRQGAPVPGDKAETCCGTIIIHDGVAGDPAVLHEKSAIKGSIIYERK